MLHWVARPSRHRVSYARCPTNTMAWRTSDSRWDPSGSVGARKPSTSRNTAWPRPTGCGEEAPRILTHLRHGHGADLAACLRAQGDHGARWAEPLGVDRCGLELAVLHDDGVSTTRMNFPVPVSSVTELSPGLSVLMLGADRCGDCHRRT